jgi:hypothetical protein
VRQIDAGGGARRASYMALSIELRRLLELHIEGDFDKAEYNHRKVDLEMQLGALRVPEQPAVEEAGETLESLGAVWEEAPLEHKRDTLQVIFKAVYVDVLGKRLVCVKPYPQFAPLFRMDGLREKEGCFYVEEEGGEA